MSERAKYVPLQPDFEIPTTVTARQKMLPFEQADLLEGWLRKLDDQSYRILELKAKGLTPAEI